MKTIFEDVVVEVYFVDVLKAIMVGNSLPKDLDLIDLAQSDSKTQIFVIVGSQNGEGTGTGGRTTTRRPPLPNAGSVTFTDGESFLRVPYSSPGRRGRIEFYFKTIQRHGVMMVTSPASGRSDFFAVEISDGDLYALYNLGGQTQRLLIAGQVNDGQAHHVIIERDGRTVTFTMDGDRHTERLSSGDDGSLDVGSTLYVGGTSDQEQLPWLLWSRKRDYYRGCLWDLRLDGGNIVELAQLRLDQGMYFITSGCADMPVDCTVTSCLNDGVCRERWTGHRCYCALTAYTGRRCITGSLFTVLLFIYYISTV